MTAMNINPKRQSQFELFPGASRNDPETGRAARLIKDLTLSLENIIVLSIVFVMVLVLFFSFGVERGRRTALRSPLSVQADLVKPVVAVPRRPSLPVIEETVVLPVEIPEEVTTESEEVVHPSLDMKNEQEKLFTIQVASFKLEKNAKEEADRLKGAGHDTFVIPKGGHSIVCVGKFIQMDEARKFSNRLKNRYNDCLVRRL
jgi:cell division septation protein DedD